MGEPVKAISRELAIVELKKVQGVDTEYAHGRADDILCDLLESLGFEDVIAEYNEVDKWYA